MTTTIKKRQRKKKRVPKQVKPIPGQTTYIQFRGYRLSKVWKPRKGFGRTEPIKGMSMRVLGWSPREVHDIIKRALREAANGYQERQRLLKQGEEMLDDAAKED